jgi:hypothetical protein
MLKDKILIYFHIATIGNYQEVVDEVFDSLNKINLVNIADKINLCIVGNGTVKYEHKPNIEYFQINDISLGEFYTLKFIEQHSKETKSNDKILYIHTKGVTSSNNECINDWRKYMLYFNIEKYIDAINCLDEYDTYGVDFVNEPTKHYSGNFWWSNSNHIKNLPSIDEISQPNSKVILTVRHNAEFWIAMTEGKHKSAHNSNINVYERHLHRYEKNKYINEND